MNLALKELALKHYAILEQIINDLASECIGGETCEISFSSGTLIIKLN